MRRLLARCLSGLLCGVLLFNTPLAPAYAAESGDTFQWEEISGTEEITENETGTEKNTETEGTESSETEGSAPAGKDETEGGSDSTEADDPEGGSESDGTESTESSDITFTEEETEEGDNLPEYREMTLEEKLLEDPMAWSELNETADEGEEVSLHSLSNQNYVHDSKFNGYKISEGIDVSEWQHDIDWNKVKAAGAEFVFIRACYRGYTSGTMNIDENFVKNINGALNAGLKVGAYVFSQAITEAEAIHEADYILSLVKGYNLALPVVMDFEYASGQNGSTGRLYNAKLSNQAATGICNAFLNRVSSAGYKPLLYANKTMLEQHLNVASIADKHPIWLAHYTTKTDYKGDYSFWQYSSKGSVSGISGNVDLNFWYIKPEDKPTRVDINRTRRFTREGGVNTGYYPVEASKAYNGAIEQIIAQRATEALNKGENSFEIRDLNLNTGTPNHLTSMQNTIFTLLDTNYQFFYVDSFGYQYNAANGAITHLYFRYFPGYANSDGSVNKDAVNRELGVLNTALDEAYGCIKPQMSNVEKILAVHDYLATVCDYDGENYMNHTVPATSYTILGTLAAGSAVAQGYALTFSTLMRRAGIDSYVVASTSMNHVWNLVSINGSWYHVDVTKDDPVWIYGTTSFGRPNNDFADEGYVSHRYFLKSDAEMTEHYGYQGAVPAAGNSNAFIGYVFYGMDQKMNYYDSYWYCLNNSGAVSTGGVKKAKIDGSNSMIISLKNAANYVIGIDNLLYYATAAGVYAYNIASGSEQVIADITQKYPGYELSELTFKGQQLKGVLYNNSTRDFLRVTFDSAVRISGLTRYATAIEAAEIMRNSEAVIKNNGKFPAVVVANADNFPDALSGSTLAAQNHAPILLVGKSGGGTQETLDYINKYVDKAGKVYLLGGTGAIPEAVEKSLQYYGFSSIRRLAGMTRYETNLQIINEMTFDVGTDVIIASGKNYADSLSVSSIAGIRNMPIFLVGDTMDYATILTIGRITPANIYIIGGTGAVNTTVESQARNLCSNVKRIMGYNRYDTSLEVARFFGMYNSDTAIFAYGGNFPDGLAGGVLAASLNAPVILVSNYDYGDQESFLKNSRITQTYIMGGTSVISNNTLQHLKK